MDMLYDDGQFLNYKKEICTSLKIMLYNICDILLTAISDYKAFNKAYCCPLPLI